MEQLKEFYDEVDIIYDNYDLRPFIKELTNLEETIENWVHTHRDVKEHDEWERYENKQYELESKIHMLNSQIQNPKTHIYKRFKGFYHCKPCGFETKSKNSLMAHLKTYDHFHTIDDRLNLSKLYCNHCDQHMESLTEMTSHSKSGKCRNNLYCSICDTLFSSKQAKQKHKCGVVRDTNTFCEICDKHFASHQSWIRHHNRYHNQ